MIEGKEQWLRERGAASKILAGLMLRSTTRGGSHSIKTCSAQLTSVLSYALVPEAKDASKTRARLMLEVNPLLSALYQNVLRGADRCALKYQIAQSAAQLSQSDKLMLTV